jgi:uncharacterized membrane protein HdeD (DUF308 family)
MATDTLSGEISKRAGWSIFMGVLTAVVGIAMIAYPFATATVTTAFFGGALLVAAVAQLFFAFSSQTAGNFFIKLLLSILYGIAGLSLVGFPVAGAVSLTAVLGILLIAEAIFEMVIAFSLPSGGGRGSFVLSSLTSLVAGVMILAAWPSSTIWAIGTLVGVAVLMNGITRVVVSSQIRSGAKTFARSIAA